MTMQPLLFRIMADLRVAQSSSAFAMTNVSSAHFPAAAAALRDGSLLCDDSLDLVLGLMRRGGVYSDINMGAVATAGSPKVVSRTSVPGDYVVALRSTHDELSATWLQASEILTGPDADLTAAMSASHSGMAQLYKTIQGAPEIA